METDAELRALPLRHPDRLAELAAYGLLDSAGEANLAPGGLDDLLAGIAQVAAGISGCGAAVVNILDATHQVQVAAYGVDPGICTLEESMCAVATVPGGRTTVVADASLDARFQRNPFVAGPLGRVRAYVSLPLVGAGGLVLGSLCVFDVAARETEPAQVAALVHLARQVVELLELRRRTAELERIGADLERSNALLTEFAGRVSHDVKAPLTAVLGFADLLSDRGSLDADPVSAGYLNRIRSAAGRMDVLVDDLLAFAAVGHVPTPQEVRLDTVVAEVVEDLEILVSETEAHVVAERRALHVDPVQLRLVLQNLLANALKYRHPERPPQVRVEVSEDVETWTLQVIDNGLGIPHHHREAVVRPLARLARDHRLPGSGLGLATCVRVAEAWGGDLRVEDAPGGGTAVSVSARR